jgi:uncharacterized protein (DUF433 family)
MIGTEADHGVARPYHHRSGRPGGKKPVIRNTRLSVDFILGLLGQDWTEADIISNYPGLTHDDIAACLCYAR